MTDTEVALLVAIAVLVLAVVVLLVVTARRRRRLQERFGPEYDRTVEHADGRRAAERELAERAERREKLDIRPLPPSDRDEFARRWRSTQEDFVDRPSLAVRHADLLVAEVMSRRGYPVGDFDQQARDVSVDHGSVVEEYRAAHRISELNDSSRATTEDLRQAMVHYRALFAELLGAHDDEPEPYGGESAPPDRDRQRHLPS